MASYQGFQAIHNTEGQGMMLLRKKTGLGLILCTLVLTASVPMLLGIEATPRAVFGGDMVALSQVNSTESLSADLVDDLKGMPNVEAASAEITCFTVIHDEPVIVRGVDIEDFLEVENSTLIRGNIRDLDRFAVIGRKLARRTGLEVGDRILITGSSSPALFQIEIDAIYKGKYSEDEILVPLNYARKMAGLSQDSVLFIRVRTTNQSALFEELETREEKLVVTDSSGTAKPVNVNISEEEKLMRQLAIKYLDTSRFKASNGSYVSMFVQEGTNSIRVVVTTFIVLDCALAFIGSAAIISRAIIERRRDIGVLSAIGANRWQIRSILIRDVLIISLIASAIGAFLGYALAYWVEDSGLLLMFGETI
ncbi:MAG: FtsX-like permease family protein, partial [Thermoplasmata archaeon]|nr:FtsX-like permease family protein [Thermoplasmata archaeon]